MYKLEENTMAIVRTEAYFNSSNGINKIRTLIWKDDELTPRGVFQIAHGMAEHIGRYDEFAKYLASNGFVVCGNDHLGHGKSVNDASELGFIAEKNGDKRLVDDMHILTKIMKKKYPDLPYFLFGHSMGSFCARVYTAHFGDELNGAIFCGTGELPAVAAALQEPINKLCEKLGLVPAENQDTVMLAILEHCAENYRGKITLESMEQSLSLNGCYISTLFMRRLGMGFHDYINSLRLSDACRLLTTTDESVSKIATEVGFGTSRTFNRVFLENFGMSPREYRIKFSVNK